MVPGVLSERLRSLRPDVLGFGGCACVCVCVFLCELNWVSDYFKGFDTSQSCFSLTLKTMFFDNFLEEKNGSQKKPQTWKIFTI